jgi:type I restriction enzyme S subunit
MGSNWKTVRLGDHVEACLGKMLDQNKNQGTLHPYLGNKQVRWGRFDLDDLSEMKFQDHEHDRYGLKPGDLVVCEGGEPGRCAIWKDEVPNMKIQKALHRIRPNSGLESTFLNYWFCYAGKFELLEPYFTGTTIKHLTGKAIAELPIPLPPLPEQKAIAHILGSLDDKIELNRKMNATLEAMAQALFKSWFVDLDPVIDNALAAGNPIPEALAERAEVRRQALANGTANREAAKAFPDSFQETEELGWIPEGWKVNSFKELAKLDTTSVKPFEHPETVWEHYSIPSYDSTAMPSLDSGNEIKSNKYQVKDGAILSSKLNPETERTWWPLMINPSAAICSTEFMQFVPFNKTEQAFVYSQIRSDPFQKSIRERVTGSTGSRQRAQPKQIAEIDIIDCGELLRAEYVRQALPLIQACQNNLLESNTLTKLRDTLLPKLISGELQIPEAEQLTEKALA